LAGDGAGDEATGLAAEYLAGLADGDLRFNGDCEDALGVDWTLEGKFGGRLFSPDEPVAGLAMAGEDLGGRRLLK
jgi:hypothetical protein